MPEICLVVSKYGKSVYNMRATVAAAAAAASATPKTQLQLRPCCRPEPGDDSDIET